jgi:putative FmdB family regulatory protein
VPIYEYRCQSCAHEYEKREGYDAPARQKCPKCGRSAQRVIQAAPIVFKGSGFYITDNRKAAPEEGAGSKSESGKASESESGKASESKSESESGKAAESKPESGKSGDDSSGKDAEPPPGADSPSAKAAAS